MIIAIKDFTFPVHNNANNCEGNANNKNQWEDNRKYTGLFLCWRLLVTI
jgi:hypothetical protein